MDSAEIRKLNTLPDTEWLKTIETETAYDSERMGLLIDRLNQMHWNMDFPPPFDIDGKEAK